LDAAKKRRIINIVATVIPTLLVVGSGVGKLVAPPAMVEGLAKYGVAEYITVLGIMEIVFVVLFIIPATMKLGFILTSCYFAGAMAAELSHGGITINPVIPLVVLWIAAFMRDKSIFLPTAPAHR
jgi:hypothetical protein